MKTLSHDFIIDVLTTWAEHPYQWFQVEYQWFQPSLSGGTAKPAVIDGKPASNLTGRYKAEERDVADKFGRWKTITPALVSQAFDRLRAGKVEGLGESRRGELIGLLYIESAGDIDINAADEIMQIAVYGEVVFG